MESFRDNEEHILESTYRPLGLNIPRSACAAKAITSLFKFYDFSTRFQKKLTSLEQNFQIQAMRCTKITFNLGITFSLTTST